MSWAQPFRFDDVWPLIASIMFKRTGKVNRTKRQKLFLLTIIEIRPFRNGWQVYEAPGFQPVFLNQEQAD